MILAVLSDVHGNLHALAAVLAHIGQQNGDLSPTDLPPYFAEALEQAKG